MEIVYTNRLGGTKDPENKSIPETKGLKFKEIFQDKIKNDTPARTEKENLLSDHLEYLFDLLEGYKHGLENGGSKTEELRPYLYQMGKISQQLQEIIASPAISEDLKELTREALLVCSKEEARFLSGIYG